MFQGHETQIAEYVIEGELPARNTERAYRASHRVLPRCARVVILHPDFVGVRKAELTLMREACMLEALHHAGVPRVFECGVVERRPWSATELVVGTTLERITAVRPLGIGQALAVLRDAAAILAHVHQRGVVHRNLTPKALLQTPERGFPLCITSWGDAASTDSVAPPVADRDAKFYRAPELSSVRAADPSADLFALGAVMYEAATLVLPEPVEKFPGIPAPFHALLAGMLSRFPTERPTAAEVHAEASRLLEVYGDGEGDGVEEVDVELIDISRVPARMGWMPPARIAPLQDSALGTLRRRR